MLRKLAATFRDQWVGTLALLLFAISGTAYAANTVFSADIVDGQVKTADLASGAVAAAKIADGAITGDKIEDATLKSRDVADNSLRGVDIDESTLTNIGGGGAAGGDLTGNYPDPLVGPNAVSGGEVIDGALTGADIDETTLDGVVRGVTVYDAEGGLGGATDVPGRFKIEYACSTTAGQPGSMRFTNQSGFGMAMFVDDGGANPQYHDIPNGSFIDVSTNGAVNAGDRTVFAYSFNGHWGTVNVDTVDRGDDCHYELQARLSG